MKPNPTEARNEMKWFGRGKKPDGASLPMLTTERLVLRAFDPSDAVDVYAYAQSEKVGPMAGWAPHRSLEDSRRVVEHFIANGDTWAVVEKRTGHVIGSIGLHKDGRREIAASRELGYALGEESWGLEYATEACREVIRYAFEELGCEVIAVCHFPSNQNSRRVIKKLGFVYEGVLRRSRRLPDGAVADAVTYSLLKEDYEAARLNGEREKPCRR